MFEVFCAGVLGRAASDGDGGGQVHGPGDLTGDVVTDASFIGVSTQYLVKLPWGQELGVFEQNIGGELFRPGAEVSLHWDPSQTFGLDGGQDIAAGADIDDEAAK